MIHLFAWKVGNIPDATSPPPDTPLKSEAGKRWEIRPTLTGWHEEGNTCGFVLGGFFELDVVEGASTVKGFSLAGDNQI